MSQILDSEYHSLEIRKIENKGLEQKFPEDQIREIGRKLRIFGVENNTEEDLLTRRQWTILKEILSSMIDGVERDTPINLSLWNQEWIEVEFTAKSPRDRD